LEKEPVVETSFAKSMDSIDIPISGIYGVRVGFTVADIFR
jgi:hypothetical protein